MCIRDRAGIIVPCRHLCNSGGFLDLPDAHLDMVRIGLLPLGVYPSKVCRRIPGVEPVGTVKTRLAVVKKIHKGDNVGYGLRYQAPGERRIGVLPVGYGDGYPRLRNQGHVLVHGKRAPVIGANAMDSTSTRTVSGKTPGDEHARRVDRYRKRWYSIDPNAGFRGKWDVTQAAILIYVAMVVPFRVGYRQPAEGAWYVVDLLIDIYFYVDVVLNFHTGYVDPDDEERVIYEPWAIARKYARTWLSIDIVACLPIDLVIRISEGRLLCSMAAGGCAGEESSTSDSSGQLLRLFKLLRLFRLMKLLRLARIARLFERYQDDLFEYLHFFAVLRLIVIMLYVGHLFGCFFHYFSVNEWRTDDELAQIDAGTLSPWLKEYFDDADHASGDVWDRYIASMYWAFTCLLYTSPSPRDKRQSRMPSSA